MKSVVDSNIIIDYLNGIEKAGKILKVDYQPVISILTYIEVLTGARKRNSFDETKELLENFEIIDVTLPIAELASEIRITQKLKLPDAVIYATAKILGTILITRNTKDFSVRTPDIRIPYKI